MGGSPKRGGRAAAGCMSRGRLILLAVLGLQLLLVACLIKAPRLIFTASSPESDLAEEEAAGGSWLWHNFVAESNAKSTQEAKIKCLDADGRQIVRASLVECANNALHRRMNATVTSFRNLTTSHESRLPRLRRPGREAEARNRSAVGELTQRRARGTELETRVWRPRRGGGVAEDNLRARRKRAAAPPIEARKRIPSHLRGSIGDSLERDSFRFRARDGYGDREVKESAAHATAPPARIRVTAHVPGSEEEELSEDALEDEGPEEDELASDIPDVAIPATSRARSSNVTTRRSNVTSLLEDAEEVEDVEELEKWTVDTAPATLSANVSSINTTLFDALAANVSGLNMTLFVARNVSSNINETLIELFGAQNASAALTANMSSVNATQFGSRNVSALATNANLGKLFANATLGDLFENVTVGELLTNATLGELFENATLGDLFANATLRELFANATLGELFANATLGEMFANATLGEMFAKATLGEMVANATLGEMFANATLGEMFANATLGEMFANATLGEMFANATLGEMFANATLGEMFANTTLGEMFANTTLGEMFANATLGEMFGNATVGEVLTTANASGTNATLEGVSTMNVSDIINATIAAQFGALNASQVEEAVPGNASSRVNVTRSADNATCMHGLIYVYTLPKKFNTELLENCSSLLQWGDRCRELSNSGLGPSLDSSPLGHSQNQSGPWYGTDQFNGDVIFHNRMLAHPCRTHDAERATAFYIPYYGGLDVARFLFNVTDRKFTAADRDRLGAELVAWLARSPYWKRRHGADHFLMLGRITWDFRRKGSHGWGSSLINMEGMANVTKLTLERSPWDDTEMAIPYPTAFHPRNEREVAQWQNALRNVTRTNLFSFAGAPRKEFPNDFRIDLFNQCRKADSCEALDCLERRCEDDALAATRLFTRSTFCLQPRGDSFTRRSIFDSLIAGCIPVFFWTRTAYVQYNWHLPPQYASYSVFLPKTEVRQGASIEAALLKLSPAKVRQMQETILEMVPRLVYAWGPGHDFRDAFDATIDQVMANFDQVLRNGTSAIEQAQGLVEDNPKQTVT